MEGEEGAPGGVAEEADVRASVSGRGAPGRLEGRVACCQDDGRHTPSRANDRGSVA